MGKQVPLLHQGCCCCCCVASVVSDSVQPHRWQPNRLLRPWDSPGKNTGMGCHFLLQCMKVRSESEVAQSRPTLRDPMDCSLPGSSVHGIFQARALEWGATDVLTTTLVQQTVTNKNRNKTTTKLHRPLSTRQTILKAEGSPWHFLYVYDLQFYLISPFNY